MLFCEKQLKWVFEGFNFRQGKEKFVTNVHITDRPEPVAVGKIICVGRNYAEHARELGNKVPDTPILFMKPSSCIVPDGGEVIIPTYSRDCHHEVELAVLIGKAGRNIGVEEALAHVAGYAVAIDLTLRDVQSELKSKGHPWEMAKAFDTSCPLSDFVPVEAVPAPQNLHMTLAVNGHLRQDGRTADMLRSVAEIIAVMSEYFSLEAGDILLTGTPAGVGPVCSGELLEAAIAGVGTLSVRVR